VTEGDESGILLKPEDADIGEGVTDVPTVFVGLAALKKAPEDPPCQLQIVVPRLDIDLGA
jgi:hypothetical protein